MSIKRIGFAILALTAAKAENDAVAVEAAKRAIQLGSTDVDVLVVLATGLYRLGDDSAALHLFRVAAGLDSLVPGEGEILGQVRDAYEAGAKFSFRGTNVNGYFDVAGFYNNFTNQQIAVNAGPVLKINNRLRYATDARGAAAFRLACEQALVPVQEFVTRSDIPCGSTVGPITAALTGACE